MVATSIVVVFKSEKITKKPRYLDERYYARRNQLLNYWCWIAIGIGTIGMLLVTLQGGRTLDISWIARCLAGFIAGVGAIELYVRYRP